MVLAFNSFIPNIPDKNAMADAQADLSLCWALMLFCWFCRAAAHIKIVSTGGC